MFSDLVSHEMASGMLLQLDTSRSLLALFSEVGPRRRVQYMLSDTLHPCEIQLIGLKVFSLCNATSLDSQ